MPGMPHRFYAPDIHAGGDVATLPADEAAHLTRVLRLGAGAAIHVFDGRGRECAAVVDAVRPAVRVRATAAVAAAPEPRVALALAQAILKGDGMDGVIRDAVMLGVSRIQPLVTAHAEIARPGRTGRWRRVALASAKQCGRAVLPEIAEPVGLAHGLAQATGDLRLILVEPGAAQAAQAESLAVLKDRPVPASATLLVGPEGGWAADELAAARLGAWLPLTLGARTLRAEAAPLVAISALWAIWGEL